LKEFTTDNYLVGYGINIALPIVCILAFFYLKHKLTKKLSGDTPHFGLFLLFLAYGGLLWGVLTSLFWRYTEMASLGYAVLFTVAPLSLITYYIRFHKTSQKSKYHSWIIKASIAYPFILFIRILTETMVGLV
jgi:hypothetical protein